MDVRINIQRLLFSICFSFILPMAFAMGVDLSLGLFPWITIGATIIFIPLATVIVTRAALSEMDQLIQEVAPLDPTQNEQAQQDPH